MNAEPKYCMYCPIHNIEYAHEGNTFTNTICGQCGGVSPMHFRRAIQSGYPLMDGQPILGNQSNPRSTLRKELELEKLHRKVNNLSIEAVFHMLEQIKYNNKMFLNSDGYEKLSPEQRVRAQLKIYSKGVHRATDFIKGIK